MARLPRADNQSGWHHVTNRGIDQRTVFRSDDDRLDFGRLIAAGYIEFGVEVLAYCLMGNHFHLVLNCPDGGLSAFMQDLGAKFTRHTNERWRGDGAVFRGRFFSRSITSNEYLLNAVRYVHRNPLDLGPRVDITRYRWCSHRTYLGLRPAPAWLSRSPVVDWFDSGSEFHAFVLGDRSRDEVATTADDLLAALAHVADEVAVDLHRAPQGLVRTAAYLLLDRVDPSTRAEVVRRLGSSTDDAVSQAVRRSRRLLRSEPALAWVVERSLDLITAPFKLCLTQLERQSQVGRVAS